MTIVNQEESYEKLKENMLQILDSKGEKAIALFMMETIDLGPEADDDVKGVGVTCNLHNMSKESITAVFMQLLEHPLGRECLTEALMNDILRKTGELMESDDD